MFQKQAQVSSDCVIVTGLLRHCASFLAMWNVRKDRSVRIICLGCFHQNTCEREAF